MLASAHLSRAAAGIICDGFHRGRAMPHHQRMTYKAENSLVISPLHRKSMGAYYACELQFSLKLGPKVGLRIIQECVL